MVLPLSKGSVLLVDASEFQGVEFDVRREGDYALRVPSRSKGRDYSRAEFAAEPQWKKVRVSFSDLKIEGKDLLNLEFVMTRKTWLELDNVRFYK